MFLAGRSPALTIRKRQLSRLLERLERAGYLEHTGLRIVRPRELGAFMRPIGRDRQIHVQVLLSEDGNGYEVFAHTEPAGFGLRHLWAALTDRVSYQHGARMLRDDVGEGLAA